MGVAVTWAGHQRDPTLNGQGNYMGEAFVSTLQSREGDSHVGMTVWGHGFHVGVAIMPTRKSHGRGNHVDGVVTCPVMGVAVRDASVTWSQQSHGCGRYDRAPVMWAWQSREHDSDGRGSHAKASKGAALTWAGQSRGSPVTWHNSHHRHINGRGSPPRVAVTWRAWQSPGVPSSTVASGHLLRIRWGAGAASRRVLAASPQCLPQRLLHRHASRLRQHPCPAPC